MVNFCPCRALQGPERGELRNRPCAGKGLELPADCKEATFMEREIPSPVFCGVSSLPSLGSEQEGNLIDGEHRSEKIHSGNPG